MTYEDALAVVEILVNAFPGDRDWSADQIRLYAQGIESLDAELATKAVLKAQATMTRRPTVADLRAITRSISVETLPPPRPAKPSKLPLWVKRWVCARYLHELFGREQDMRVFPEQRDHSDPLAPLMPPGEWEREAQQLSDRRAWTAIRAHR